MFQAIAFASVLSGAAVIALAVSVRNLMRARQSRTWPTVEGTIVEAQVVARNKGSRAKIVYRYRVAGTDYEGTRVVIGGQWDTNHDGAAKVVRRFPQGSTAKVALDPADPGYSVLVPGLGFQQVLTVIVCTIILLATLPVLWAFTHLSAAA